MPEGWARETMTRAVGVAILQSSLFGGGKSAQWIDVIRRMTFRSHTGGLGTRSDVDSRDEPRLLIGVGVRHYGEERVIKVLEMASPDVTDSEQELLDESKGLREAGKGQRESNPLSFPKKMGGRGALRKELNFIDATALLVGGTIGSGIFITPATILQETGSFGVSMLCWLVGMVISILGALCYIELGLLIPKTGGEYLYILNAYTFRNRNKWVESLGSLLAFLFTWTNIFVIRPSSSAIVTLTCARYLTRPLYIGCEIPVSVLKTLALFIIILQAGIVSRSVKLMAKTNTVVTLLKLLTIVFIVAVGIAGVIKRGCFPEDFKHPFRGSSFTSASDVGGLAVAVYGVMWAYSGWNNFNYTVEELKEPERTLPRAMVVGMLIVSVCYFLVNLSFFSVLSYDEILSTQAVALPFGEAVMGKAGLVVIPLFVAVSTFGADLSNVYVSSRLVFSSAREGQFPAVFCGVHKTWHSPIASIVFHTLVSSVYIAAGDVRSLIDSFNAAHWVFFTLVFAALLIMRVTYRNEKRLFKVWLILPIIMIVVSLLLIFLPLTSEPGPSFVAFAIILCGAPVYVVLVMETPWKLRPAILDRCSDFITKHINKLLKAESSRLTMEKL